MARAAAAAGVSIVTGDTKVVERGKGDGVFVTTSGVGVVPDGIDVAGNRVRPGDKVLVSGTMGDHGVAIMSLRENLAFTTTIASDTAALHGLVAAMLAAVPRRCTIRRARASRPLNRSLANQLRHRDRRGTDRGQASRRRCEFLGLDPLYVANEANWCGRAPENAERVLAALRAHPLGRNAAIVGEAIADPHHFVQMDTAFGGRRIVDWLTGEQLPRIC
jgi:hydrogenase expression/formation protein HypE